jgi:hypothetical protein
MVRPRQRARLLAQGCGAEGVIEHTGEAIERGHDSGCRELAIALDLVSEPRPDLEGDRTRIEIAREFRSRREHRLPDGRQLGETQKPQLERCALLPSGLFGLGGGQDQQHRRRGVRTGIRRW